MTFCLVLGLITSDHICAEIENKHHFSGLIGDASHEMSLLNVPLFQTETISIVTLPLNSFMQKPSLLVSATANV